MQTRKKGWSRSKRGCKTCRIRHVRCDETFPACRKCTSTGRVCDGIAPLASSDSWKIMTPMNAIGIPEMPSRSQPPCENANASFQYFRSRTVCYLSRLLGTEWEDVILRASLQSQPIRYAILAVGNVHQMVETQRIRTISANQDDWAVKQYNKSMRALADNKGSKNNPIDVVLATCILYICFETLHRNHGVVLKHVRGGLDILHEYRTSIHEDSQDTLIPLQQLTAAFARLETQFCEVSPTLPRLYTDLIQVRDITGYYSYCRPLPLPIPHFETFESAWIALDQCWHAGRSWLTETEEYDYISASPSKHRLLLQRDWLFTDFSMWKLGFDAWKASQVSLTEHEICVSALLECHAHLAIQNLKTVPVPGEMSWDASLDEFEKVVDLCHKVVEAETKLHGISNLVKIEHRYISSPRSKVESADKKISLLSLGMGIIPILFHVVQKCRDANVRLQVITLLESHLRLEGLWDGPLVAQIGRLIDEVERQTPNLEEAAARKAAVQEIPAWSRVLGIDIRFNTEGLKQADLLFARLESETSQKVVQIHKSVEW